MKYIQFTIDGYRGIVEPLTIKIKEGSPIALVGFNESGKSTIIDSIYAFDFENDIYNDTYKQLENISNLYRYRTDSHEAHLRADILLKSDEDFSNLLAILTENDCLAKTEIEEKVLIEKEEPKQEDIHVVAVGTTMPYVTEENIEKLNVEEPQFEIVKKLVINETSQEKQFTSIKEKIKILKIERLLRKDKSYDYKINGFEELDKRIFDVDKIIEKQSEIAKKIIEFLPTMLYVREFESFMEEITLNPNAQQKKSEKQYRDLFNNLFLSATENNTSLDDFIKITDSRESQPILNRVKRYLNEEFTKRWTKFNIEHNFSELSLDIIQNNGKMKILVSEKIGEDEYNFNISDRSSGFKWYFNFIMRTVFNPIHKNGKNKQTLYLMDEPGTFLHETSQKSFAQELKDIIKGNFLIYTTHHFQMINLKNISLNNIYIVEKFDKLITANKTTHYVGFNEEAKKGAMLPIFHTLRFTFLDMIRDEQDKAKKFLIVEGLHDYYFINLFIKDNKTLKNIEIYPSVGADQIISNLPEFNFYNQGVYALFDNDERGVKAKEDFLKHANKDYENRVFVLPFTGYEEDKTKSFTMNDVMGNELINELCLNLIDMGVYLQENNYKYLMEALFENPKLCERLKANTGFKDRIEKLKSFLIEKLQ